MTLVNWISIGIAGMISVVCITLKIYYRIKIKKLDGVIGVIPSEEE